MARSHSENTSRKKISTSHVTVGQFEKQYKIRLHANSAMRMTTYLKRNGQETFAKVLEKAEKAS